MHADTDCFIVLEADAQSGRVTNSGAIDAESIKTEVIDYLEGGVKTYGVKYRKYGMGKRINDWLRFAILSLSAGRTSYLLGRWTSHS